MSSDLTLEEQRQFADKKLNKLESTDPITGQVTIKNIGSKGGRKTKKSKSKKYKKRLSLKLRKVR